MIDLIERLSCEHRLDAQGYFNLITACDNDDIFNLLRDKATQTARKQFGFGIFIRGLIEISSYCKNNCFYCGLRRGNIQALRYRLADEEIMDCCKTGYAAGFRTFVLQGGEDAAFTDDRLTHLIANIHNAYPDAAITLSLGERSTESYQLLYDAGASRYLLRHEAANASLYSQIHPSAMSHDNRINCIKSLKEIGYQTGIGMMVGFPGQTINHLVEDLQLIEHFRPHMIGVGPFIPHRHTPFGFYRAGDLRLTLTTIAIARLICPGALIPSTTALATLSPTGRVEGILSGANVVMPNLSPLAARAKYNLYDNKKTTDAEAAENLSLLQYELQSIGYHINPSRGDYSSN